MQPISNCMILGQASEIVTGVGTATNFLRDRTDAMVILVLLIVCAVLWVWKVVLPNQTSQRRNGEKLVEIQQSQATTLGKLSDVCGRTDERTQHSNTTLAAIFELKKIEIDCLKKMSDVTSCDIKEQLAEMNGVIRAVEHGGTVKL